MSLHLMDCVKPLHLQPSLKLALMAFADSAGDGDSERIGYPGLDAVMRWACVGRSQASDLIRDLVEVGLLRSHSRGHKGRNARYVVFPNGCCDQHAPRPAASSTPADVSDVAAALGVELNEEQLAALEALAQGPADRNLSETKGSGQPDSVHGNGSGTPDPLPDEGSGPPASTAPAHADHAVEQASGAGQGPAHRHRLLGLHKTTPPTPHASGAGGACQGQHDNCRGCGTTRRQLRDAAQRQAKVDAAADSGPRCPGGFRWTVDGGCGCPPPVGHPSRVELEHQAAS